LAPEGFDVIVVELAHAEAKLNKTAIETALNRDPFRLIVIGQH